MVIPLALIEKNHLKPYDKKNNLARRGTGTKINQARRRTAKLDPQNNSSM
jgi:hypothetical protein